MAKAIDTLKAAVSLKEAGLNEEQAEAIVEIIASSEESIATKADIELLDSRLTNKIYAIGISIAALVVGMNVLF
ncbi:hypothetical protein MJD09_25685 [bacterium]|nr:hypothetical protein [bacterium]